MSADTLTADGAPVTLSPFGGSDRPITYTAISGADEVAVAYQSGPGIQVVGYDLAGNQIFSNVSGPGGGALTSVQSFTLAPAGGSGFVMAWDTSTYNGGPGIIYTGGYQLIDGAGHTVAQGAQANAYGFTAFFAPDGVHLEWDATGPDGSNGQPTSYQFVQQDISASGAAGQPYSGFFSGAGNAPEAIVPYASTQIGSLGNLIISDNEAAFPNNIYYSPVNLPGEPGHGGVTDLAAAGLASGTTAAVAWVDSGTDYVSIFNASTNSFSSRVGLDWGGAHDVHLVALPDGGFVVSWENGGAYKGEVFDAAGNGGGIITLAGDVAGIDSHGDLYTVGLKPDGSAEVVQTYAISGGSSGGSGSGGDSGQTFTSDNNGDHWVGTAGNDIFNLGRGGDVVTGGGGDDTFKFAEIPWAGGHITDFNAGDVLDLAGLMATTSDTGRDGFADGYLKITDDGQGNAQVWADYHLTDNDGWWLVTTLDGVAPASLQHKGEVISVAASSGGGTPGQTFTSDNSGDHWTGTAGNDTFNLGRGGDVVTGNGGNDTFRFAEIPWAAGQITDFNAGDVLDLTGLVASTGYTGSNPVEAGYVRITPGAFPGGGAQILARYDVTSNNWWTVTTLTGVSADRIAVNGDLISIQPPSTDGSVSTAVSDYAAPRDIKTITLTGAQQVVHASNYQDTTIYSNDTGNRLFGGSGDDTFHMGLGGDYADGGAGKDVFVFDAVPTKPDHINAFYAEDGDSINVTGLLARAGYVGIDPVADGYLKLVGNQVYADDHQPGGAGMTLVATADGAGNLLYEGHGVIAAGQVGGPAQTYSTSATLTWGMDTGIITGTGQTLTANTAGDTLIDQGQGNILVGSSGNDTYVLGPSTKEVHNGAADINHFSGASIDTIVMNGHPTAPVTVTAGIETGEKIDVRQLLAGVGYSGMDPLADGTLQILPHQPANSSDTLAEQIFLDPDGSAGPAPGVLIANLSYTATPFHYQDGWLIVP